MNRKSHRPGSWSLALATAAALTGGPAQAAGDDAATLKALQQQLQQIQAELKGLAEENRALKEHEAEVDRKLAALNAPAGGTAPVAQAVPVAPAAAVPDNTSALPNASALPSTAALSPTATASPGTTGPGLFGTGLRLWGYGEVYYTNPTSERQDSQFDLARAVFGIGYQFDEKTEFNSEYEVEHAVASADDPGEFEVEQFYVDRHLNDYVTARAGLFLMPFGLLNEHHEPTNFYGVQRNFVETLIIPSTWREGGLNFHGDTPLGIGWNAGVTTGFDLSKWDFAPEFPPYHTALDLENSGVAPLQATHQELALANGRHLSQYLALSYYGVPGLNLGAAISTGDAVPVPAPPNAPIPGNQRVALWEAHARWTPGPFDLTALYARGTISNTALINQSNPGSPNPIPSAFYGYYFQGAMQAWQHGDYKLNPFVRYEVYNMGSKYDGTAGPVIPEGDVPLSAAPGDYGRWPVWYDRVWTVGANFYLGPHLVLKTDYQWFKDNVDFKRWDLGLGIAF
ncbi:MAG: porin [Proteobacteria bacterium]|nr:porin [Pseudomonadota bacterium]